MQVCRLSLCSLCWPRFSVSMLLFSCVRRYYDSSPSDTRFGFRILYKKGSGIVFATKDRTSIVFLGRKDGVGSLRRHPGYVQVA